jgi:hypothetical protein
MGIPRFATIGLLVAIGLLNSIISYRMRSQLNARLPPTDQIPWWWRGSQMRTLQLHKELFPQSSLRWWWLISAASAFLLIGVLLFLES